MNQLLKNQLLIALDQLDDEQGRVALAVANTLARPVGGRGNFTALLGLDIISAGEGKAHTRVEMAPHLFNRIDILHGGAAYTIADVTTGVAGLSLLSGQQKIVTQDLHYRYHGMVKKGTIDAYAEVIHQGSRTMVVHAKLYARETLIGSADGTFALVNQAEIDR